MGGPHIRVISKLLVGLDIQDREVISLETFSLHRDRITTRLLTGACPKPIVIRRSRLTGLSRSLITSITPSRSGRCKTLEELNRSIPEGCLCQSTSTLNDIDRHYVTDGTTCCRSRGTSDYQQSQVHAPSRGQGAPSDATHRTNKTARSRLAAGLRGDDDPLSMIEETDEQQMERPSVSRVPWSNSPTPD